MCYGAELNDAFNQAAAYIDRILRGEKPGQLPIQAATNFRLVINLWTAQVLGLRVTPLAGHPGG